MNNSRGLPPFQADKLAWALLYLKGITINLVSPEMLNACVQTLAMVLAPIVLIGTLIFALRAPRPGEGDEGDT